MKRKVKLSVLTNRTVGARFIFRWKHSLHTRFRRKRFDERKWRTVKLVRLWSNFVGSPVNQRSHYRFRISQVSSEDTWYMRANPILVWTITWPSIRRRVRIIFFHKDIRRHWLSFKVYIYIFKRIYKCLLRREFIIAFYPFSRLVKIISNKTRALKVYFRFIVRAFIASTTCLDYSFNSLLVIFVNYEHAL